MRAAEPGGHAEAPLWRSATEISREVRAGKLSAQAVLEAHLRRIEVVNQRLNAIVLPRFEAARAEAAALDAARARGEPLGPLAGVPITIKECFDLAGMQTTVGLPARVGRHAAADAPLVGQLRAAGAIVVGKTNLSQLMLFAEADNPVYGRTANPWALDRSPGGSSGGEAAIIAAGGVPLGLGSDIGGSVRIPAHSCGLCALKPTAGRLTMIGTGDLWAGQEGILDQAGPLARTVADLYLALRVLARPGQEAIDPAVPPVPLGDPEPIALPGLRVGFYEDDGVFAAAPSLRRAVRESAYALRARGADVEPFVPPDPGEAVRLWLGIIGAAGGAPFRRELRGGKVDRRIRQMALAAGLGRSGRATASALARLFGQHRLAAGMRVWGRRSTSAYWDLLAARARYRARFLAALDAARLDAVVCPPLPLPALRHGTSLELGAVHTYTLVYNVTGMPAGVVAAARVRV